MALQIDPTKKIIVDALYSNESIALICHQGNIISDI